MSGPLVKDKMWIKQAFLVKSSDLTPKDAEERTFTTASMKFTDTTLGGNFAINPPPQFTRAADPKVSSRYSASKGMGRYYSEAIDDNNQLISMRFGVPQFNSLTTFFTGFYNSGMGRMARTGRATYDISYLIGRAAGFVVSVIYWPVLVVQAVGVGLRFLLNKPSSKFYYLKPTMPLYWNAVTTIVNHIAVNKGIIPRVGAPEVENGMGLKYEFDDAAWDRLAKQVPDIFRSSKSRGIDVYAMATRAQRLARQHYKAMEKAFENPSLNLNTAIQEYSIANLEDRPKNATLDAYVSSWHSINMGRPRVGTDGKEDTASTEGLQYNADGSKDQGAAAGWWDFLSAELDDGAAFVTFRVDSTGSVSESFSNSVGESDIAASINNMSKSSRSTNFTFANGNIAGVLDGIVDAAKGVISGISDQFGISGLAALGGAAFVDIPKHWQDSSASLPRSTYTMTLVSPYGNPISRLINIDIPIAMLLAAALPMSTGKQSYTSPFLLELYDQGRCQTRLGMIDSLSITRGTGNMGFTNEGQMLQAEVSFSIVDMSSIMHMPISEGFTLNPATAFFDDDTVFTDYMAVLAGMKLTDQIYAWKKFKLNLTRQMAHWNSFFSTSHFINFVGDTIPARLASAWFKGKAR